MTKFHKTRPSLFQISGEKICFLVDFYALRDSPILDKKLSEIFSNKDSVIIGFSFSSDVAQFAKNFPQLKFYKYATNFLELQDYYSKVYTAGEQTGLAKVAEAILGKKVCKQE